MPSNDSPRENSPLVRIASNFSEAVNRVEELIRERAYQLFLHREPEAGNSVKDWMDARKQLLAPIDLALKEQKKKVVVEGILKGFKPGEIEVEVGSRELKVFGSHTESANESRPGLAESTSSAVYFYESLPLPCEVDVDTAEVTFLKNGKLKISLPKKPQGH